MIVRAAFALLFILAFFLSNAQPDRWQQRAYYQMDIDFDVNTHKFKGKQRLVYQNNSPDTLTRVFYHLYFNAFQPGSMMDVKSRTVMDPDPRVESRIFYLKENEIGYQRIQSLEHNGTAVKFSVEGTILEVDLIEPILPQSSAVFDMQFESQVPVQIRRSGRDSKEGIAYSMSQWYPKMCEYDYQGWHANPYVGREFYGVWGEFDVKITIDSSYTIGGTGYLQNPHEIGHGYGEKTSNAAQTGNRLTWHFFAPNVHDFMWAADPDYTHESLIRKDGIVLHFFYQKNERTAENWAVLPKVMDRAFDYINKHFGQYPYKQYSFIQGGDGGMEYPMSTLITGERTLGSLIGVSIHELMHSWYQMILGTNESLYAWMDEGFTDYAEEYTKEFLKKEKLLGGKLRINPIVGSYSGYFGLANSGFEEPMITHSDHFTTNSAYGVSSYSKGAVFLHQLEYIIGVENLRKGLLQYFDMWKFKHPNANDFIRVMEKVSGLELDWYKEYWVHTTHTIDYGIRAVDSTGRNETTITLQKLDNIPMPIDVVVNYSDGSKELFNIPLRIMRGNKPNEGLIEKYSIIADWPWTHPFYEFKIPVSKNKITRIEIDPSKRLADIARGNNVYERGIGEEDGNGMN